MGLAVVLVCGVAGLAAGAEVNVLIARMPVRVPLGGRLRCAGCDAAPRWGDSVPVVSYVTTHGRCRSCGEAVPVQEPVVEAVTGVLWALVAWRFGLDWALPAYLLLAAVLVAVTVIDVEHYLIPNRLVFPALGAEVVLLVAAGLLDGTPLRIVDAALGSVAYFGLLFAFNLISPRGMGMGDVKLALVLGWCLGYLSLYSVLLGMLLSSLLGAVLGIGALAVRRRSGAFPFGPALAAGTMLTVLLSGSLLDVRPR